MELIEKIQEFCEKAKEVWHTCAYDIESNHALSVKFDLESPEISWQLQMEVAIDQMQNFHPDLFNWYCQLTLQNEAWEVFVRNYFRENCPSYNLSDFEITNLVARWDN